MKQLRLRDTGVTTSGLRALLQGSGAGAGSAASKTLLLLDVSSCRGIGPEGFDLGPRVSMLCCAILGLLVWGQAGCWLLGNQPGCRCVLWQSCVRLAFLTLYAGT